MEFYTILGWIAPHNGDCLKQLMLEEWDTDVN